MLTKMADVYSTVNTEKNIFYSAYMKGKVQYNDVDPDKVLLLLSQDKIDVIEDIKIDVIEDIKIEETGIDNVIEEIKDNVIEDDSNSKIIVTVYDISSNPSSSNDLQNLDSQV